jgi:predicted double-glycine peptidase
MKYLNFPKLRQTYRYDCGASALQSVLVYYGIEIRKELIIKIAKTNKKDGTTIKGMLNALKKYGLKFNARQMTILDLKNYIDKKIPVITILQAWNGRKVDYTKKYNDGHWVVAIGYDNEKLFFEDPSSFYRTFLTYKEFENRWHSKENKKKIINYGIAVYGKQPAYNPGKVVHMD